LNGVVGYCAPWDISLVLLNSDDHKMHALAANVNTSDDSHGGRVTSFALGKSHGFTVDFRCGLGFRRALHLRCRDLNEEQTSRSSKED